MANSNVKVEAFQGRLRLRWRIAGQAYSMSLGLDDSVLNRRIADAKAVQIQLDILSDNFDVTLNKYRPQHQKHIKKGKPKTLTFQQLWEEYQSERQKDIAERTYKDKFKALQKRINDFGKDIRTQNDAEEFKAYLEQFNKAPQVLDKILNCSACYRWGIQQGYAQMDWFERIKPQIKVEPTQDIEPFNADEIRIILDGFQYPKYLHYYEYVQFLFLTGCRTSEAIGLKWKHIKKDYSEIWIGETKTRGIDKSTKTNKARVFPCNSQLKKLLENRFNNQVNLADADYLDKYVFLSPSGKSISDTNFCNRVWKPCLTDMGIKYRSPYLTRHSFISHMLQQGMKPLELASLTGHNVKVLYERYAGLVSVVTVPEMPV